MRYLFLVFIVIGHQTLIGQVRQCLAHEYYKEALEKNPDLEIRREQLTKRINEAIKTKGQQKNRAVIKMPLVFHVIFNTSAQNIDSTQIASQIDVINADFRKLNANFNIVEGGFVNLAADIEFEFELADIDPDGNPTTGITRTVTTNPAIGGSDTEYFDPEKGGVAAWDPKRYINVWVVNINSAGGDFGFASFPGEADPIESDGIVIDYKNLGTIGTAATSDPQDLGRTMTHELGHYFGLFHIWGDIDDCSIDDQIDDTPPQETSTETCPTYPQYDACTVDGDGINFYNYMDYTDDACMAMFTADQKAKMQAVMTLPFDQGGRSELAEFFVNTRTIPSEELKVYPNPSSSIIQLNLDEAIDFGNVLKVRDINGRIITTKIIDQSNLVLDLNDHPNGLYFIEIRTAQTLWYSKIVLLKEQ